MSKNKGSSSSKTEHVPGPVIISPLLGGGGDYHKTTITEKDGSKTTGYGRSAEESQKNASNKRK